MSLPDAMLTHPYWYLGRATGLVAYVILTMSTALGLTVSSRIGDGLLNRAFAYEMHRFLSLLALGVMVTHALVMVPDPYAGFSAADVLVPFHSGFRTVSVALGIVGLYLAMLVTGTSFLTKRIGQRTWRAVHYSAFLLFLLATGHGVWTGTDGSLSPVRAMYYGSALSVLFLTFYRILAVRSPKRAPNGGGPSARMTRKNVAPRGGMAS